MSIVVGILAKLVSIPSVSSLSNTPLIDAIESLLTPHGWRVMRSTYIAADGLEKANLLAVPEKFVEGLPKLDLLFVCHTDTVPYRPDWEGATQLTELSGSLHGCGACDVKGSMASLLAAALAVDPEAMSSSVGFAFTAEEELGCIGATKLVASGLVRPKRVIVCEPTSMRPATAGKGYGLAEVVVRGHEAHSAFPAKGVSAIQVAALFIMQLEEQLETMERASDQRFWPSHTTFNVGVLHGGTAKNIVAGECHFLVEWRPIPSEEPKLGGELLQRLAADVAARRHTCEIDVHVMRADPGFSNGPGATLGAQLAQRLARPETGISFGSEATRFAPVAGEVVVIGPGDMETAHSERECVPMAELDEWTSTVQELLLGGMAAESALAEVTAEA